MKDRQWDLQLIPWRRAYYFRQSFYLFKQEVARLACLLGDPPSYFLQKQKASSESPLLHDSDSTTSF